MSDILFPGEQFSTYEEQDKVLVSPFRRGRQCRLHILKAGVCGHRRGDPLFPPTTGRGRGPKAAGRWASRWWSSGRAGL